MNLVCPALGLFHRHYSKGRSSTYTYRTHTCGELTQKDVGKAVTLCGWTKKKRLGPELITKLYSWPQFRTISMVIVNQCPLFVPSKIQIMCYWLVCLNFNILETMLVNIPSTCFILLDWNMYTPTTWPCMPVGSDGNIPYFSHSVTPCRIMLLEVFCWSSD